MFVSLKTVQHEKIFATISISISFITTLMWIMKIVFDRDLIYGYIDWCVLVFAVFYTFTLTFITYGLKMDFGKQVIFGLETKFIYGSCFGFLLVLIMSIPFTN